MELLSHIYVEVPCPACNGSFQVSLGEVLDRHRLVEERGMACPECDSTAFDLALNPALLEDIEGCWSKLDAELSRHSLRPAIRGQRA